MSLFFYLRLFSLSIFLVYYHGRGRNSIEKALGGLGHGQPAFLWSMPLRPRFFVGVLPVGFLPGGVQGVLISRFVFSVWELEW